MVADVIFLTGAPGVGKSTLGRLLAETYDKALFIDLDEIRDWVVSGLSQPSQGWSDETTKQFDLAHVAAGKMAHIYSQAGFAVVVAHCSNPDSFERFKEHCPHARVVCLVADLETNLHRNATRTNKNFDPKDIAFFVHDLAPSLHKGFAEQGHPVLDTSGQNTAQSLASLRAVLAE